MHRMSVNTVTSHWEGWQAQASGAVSAFDLAVSAYRMVPDMRAVRVLEQAFRLWTEKKKTCGTKLMAWNANCENAPQLFGRTRFGWTRVCLFRFGLFT